MRNKVIISFMFLICVFFIPSFCHAFFFDYNGVDYDMSEYNFYDYTFAFKNGDYAIDIWSFSTTSSLYFSIDSNNKFSFGKERETTDIYAYWYRISLPDGSISILYNNKYYSYESVFSAGSASSIGSSSIISSNFDILDGGGKILFEDSTKIKFNLHVEPSEQTTNVPVKIFTDWYSLEDFSDVLVKYSYDNEKWENCGWERYMDPSSGQEESLWRFELDVYNNDTYYFKFFDLRNNREECTTVVIKNIVYTQDNPRKLY